MLKKFFLNILSSFVGTWIALILFGIAAVLITIGVAASFGDTGKVASSVKKHSILVLELDGQITEALEAHSPDYLKLIQGEMEKPQTLNQIVEGIKAAKDHDNVEAM